MLKLYQSARSPHWYIRGVVDGIEIYESTKTSDRAQAQTMLDARQGHIYREVIVRSGDLPTISKDMMKELVALASRARNRSQKRGMGGGLTAEQVVELFIQQRGRCAVSGIVFHLEGDTLRERAFAPSVDRIDNAKGYEPRNVRLVCRIANYAMNIWGDKALLELSLAVTSVWEKMCAHSVRVHMAQDHSTKENTNEINKKGPHSNNGAAQV